MLLRQVYGGLSCARNLCMRGHVSTFTLTLHRTTVSTAQTDTLTPTTTVSGGPRWSTRKKSKKSKETMAARQTRLFLHVYKALLHFRALHGHVNPPRNYVVAEDNDVASDIVGCKLGVLVGSIRSRAHWMYYPFKEALTDLGVVPPDSQDFRQFVADDVEHALQIYASLHGNLDIPFEFTIPSDTSLSFRTHMHHAPLGRILQQIRDRRLFFTFADVYHRWRKLGIKFSITQSSLTETTQHNGTTRDEKTMHNLFSNSNMSLPREGEAPLDQDIAKFELLIDAFKHFKMRFEHVNVPQTFVFDDKSNWPEHLVRYNLGKKMNHIRHAATWVRDPFRKKLEEMGIVQPESEEWRGRYSATDIESALSVYKSQHGDLSIPLDFVISATEDGSVYPAALAGAPLGLLLDLICKRRLYFNPKDLALRWRKLDVPFEQLSRANVKY